MVVCGGESDCMRINRTWGFAAGTGSTSHLLIHRFINSLLSGWPDG